MCLQDSVGTEQRNNHRIRLNHKAFWVVCPCCSGSLLAHAQDYLGSHPYPCLHPLSSF